MTAPDPVGTESGVQADSSATTTGHDHLQGHDRADPPRPGRSRTTVLSLRHTAWRPRGPGRSAVALVVAWRAAFALLSDVRSVPRSSRPLGGWQNFDIAAP